MFIAINPLQKETLAINERETSTKERPSTPNELRGLFQYSIRFLSQGMMAPPPIRRLSIAQSSSESLATSRCSQEIFGRKELRESENCVRENTRYSDLFTPIVTFCAFLQNNIKNRSFRNKLRFLCDFSYCYSDEMVHRTINEIQKNIIIYLSKLAYYNSLIIVGVFSCNIFSW